MVRRVATYPARLLLTAAVWAPAGPLAAAGASAPPAATAELTRFEVGALPPRSVANLRLESGAATFELRSGTLWPITTAGGRALEWVFVGSGRIQLDPPDDVEAGQLELFTGARELDEEFRSAVVAVASDAAEAALSKRPVGGDDTAALAAARSLAEAWRASAERRLLEVDAALWADAAGERLLDGYFAAWIEGVELGRFLYVVDPTSAEQVTLGRFEPLEAEARDRRKIEKQLRREQREGRLLGQRFEDLGVFDHWVSTSQRSASGEPRPGNSPFEASHYQIEASVDESREEVAGELVLEMVPVVDQARVVPLLVHPDLVVDSVTVHASGSDPASGELPRVRGSRVLVVRLPRAAAPNDRPSLRIIFRGKLLERGGSSWAVRDTIYWHPHLGTVDRATYDVTLDWPERLSLAAGGLRIEGGSRAAGRPWERRVREQPPFAFGFEVGRYRVESFEAAGVAIRLGFDPDGRDLGSEARQEIRQAIGSGLEFLSETLGPPPMRELAVVSTPRDFSQSLPGLVTLSTLMMSDFGWLGPLLGIEDRRTVIVHELAHQWWGHLVGWSGYRDQWLSEAVPNYVALAWSRAELPREERPAFGPTSGWRSVLEAETEDGRTIESLGPVVVGQRLSSSKSGSAYAAIVYKKGAIVLDMIANALGQEQFLELLGKATKAARGRRLTTEDFFAVLERLAGTELDDFTRRYVYGTGEPEVFYEYAFARDGEKWVVEGSARQETSWRRNWAVERTAEGGFVVRLRGETRTDAATDLVITPLQIGLYLPEHADARERRRVERGETPAHNRVLTGRIALRGEATPFRFVVDHRPVRFWLDREGEAFARFRDATRSPKLAAIRRASRLEAAADAAGAESAWREALAADLYPPDDERGEADRRRGSRRVDAHVRADLAELALDRGDLVGAERELAAANELVDMRYRDNFAARVALIEGRLALARGDGAGAWKKLRKASSVATEVWLYRALAARAAGRDEDLGRALEEAERRGADVSALR